MLDWGQGNPNTRATVLLSESRSSLQRHWEILEAIMYGDILNYKRRTTGRRTSTEFEFMVPVIGSRLCNHLQGNTLHRYTYGRIIRLYCTGFRRLSYFKDSSEIKWLKSICRLKTRNGGNAPQRTTPQIYLQEEYLHLASRTVIYVSMDLYESTHLRNGHIMASRKY